jgi:2-polyprenyl-3-methyl-5-hydroxy-6-metoxy-1,4-benzoquinol methylase
MAKSIADVVYPERRFGGFSRVDGTIAFYTRIAGLLNETTRVLDIGCGRGQVSETRA